MFGGKVDNSSETECEMEQNQIQGEKYESIPESDEKPFRLRCEFQMNFSDFTKFGFTFRLIPELIKLKLLIEQFQQSGCIINSLSTNQ